MKSILLTLPLSVFALPLMGQGIDTFTCPIAENSFRGLSALNDSSLWVSSNQGQVWFFSLSNGWDDRSPEGYDTIQWRDIEAFNDSSAIILSAGSPGLILNTTDAGRSWREVYRNDDPKIFFDAMDFSGMVGYAFADAMEHRAIILQTTDGGQSWKEYKKGKADYAPIANQGGFAASGSCLKTISAHSFALVMGGDQALLKYHDGQNTSFIEIPFMDAGAPSKGPFSIDMIGRDTLIIAGGDYLADSLSHHSLVLSYDAGKTWIKPNFPAEFFQRYWSAVQWHKNTLILCSRFGTAVSQDNGQTWEVFPDGFYATDHGWFSGPQGRIGRFRASSE